MRKRGTYTGIVLAGGLSSRMGVFKPLLDIGGKPALYRLLDAIHDAGIRRVVIVTGYGYDKINAAIDAAGTAARTASTEVVKVQGDGANQIHLIYNEDYERGMFTSVQTGIRFAASHPPHQDDILLFPADVPLVKSETISGLIDTFEKATTNVERSFAEETRLQATRRPFAMPVFEKKNGHPLLIPHEYVDEILIYGGGDGLKGVRAGYDADVIKYEVTDAGCVLDMDTPEDYTKLLEYYDKRKK